MNNFKFLTFLLLLTSCVEAENLSVSSVRWSQIEDSLIILEKIEKDDKLAEILGLAQEHYKENPFSNLSDKLTLSRILIDRKSGAKYFVFFGTGIKDLEIVYKLEAGSDKLMPFTYNRWND